MNDLFLREARGEPTERRPVWMMRQAGRYLAEYRAVRSRVDFLTLCRTPDLVAEVTLQPVDLVGVDAAILFADILLPLDAMGANLTFVQGDGPTFPEPVRRREDFSRLSPAGAADRLDYVYRAIETTRRELAGRDEPVPLIGFGGTPWTLAAYLVEGGGSPTYPHLLAWSWRDPEGLAEVLDVLAEVSADYLQAQVEAGAQALQLFDTWGGLLDLERYRRLALPPLQKVVERLRPLGVPLVYFLKTGAHLLPAVGELPVDVFSVDWRLPLDEVRSRLPAGCALQGNLDPMVLLTEPDEIERQTRRVLDAGAGGPHIVNLGHGIHKTTPPDNARAFIEAVKRHSGPRRASGQGGAAG